MLNRVTIMGRLTRDPELRRTESGIAVASFAIACDRDYSGKQNGEKEVDFFDIVAWRNTAEFVSNYFGKGRMIVVAGRLQTRSWTDKEGNKRKTTEVVADSCYFGDSKPETAPQQLPTGQPTYNTPQYNQPTIPGYSTQSYRTGNLSTNPAEDDYPQLYGEDGHLPF